MTTATKQGNRVTGTRTLVVTMVAVDVVVVAVAVVAALAEGSDAAVAALVGGFLATMVLFSGTVVVNLVAGLMPSASLLVALMTYVLQVALLAVLFLALAASPLGDDDISRTWVAVAVVAATLAWLIGQIVTTSRARIPVYDLPDRPARGDRPAPDGRG